MRCCSFGMIPKYFKLYIWSVNYYAKPNLTNYIYYFKPHINLEFKCYILLNPWYSRVKLRNWSIIKVRWVWHEADFLYLYKFLRVISKFYWFLSLLVYRHKTGFWIPSFLRKSSGISRDSPNIGPNILGYVRKPTVSVWFPIFVHWDSSNLGPRASTLNV